MNWYETLDRALADFAHSIQVSAGTVATPVLRVISVLGNGGAIFIAAAVVFLLFRKTRTTGISALIALLIGALVTNLLLKNVIARERPFVDENSVYFTYWLNTGSMAASGYSFPSGHTTAAMAFATALFLHGNKKISWLAFLIPLLMGFSRIYFSVHFCTDVLAGMAAGLVAGILAWTVVLLLRKNRYFVKFEQAQGIVGYIRSKRGKDQ